MNRESIAEAGGAGSFPLPPGFLPRVCGVAAAASVASALILISFGHVSGEAGTTRAFVVPFVYSYSIAVPSAVLLFLMGSMSPDSERRPSLLKRVGVLVATNTAGCLFGGLVLGAFQIYPWFNYWSQFRFAAKFGAVITLTFGLSMDFYENVRTRLDLATLQEERARKLAAEARLSSLESRIHPHFLFNTLNSISSLIPTDPKRAEDVLGKLAALLRFSLSANQMGLISLGQEIQIVRNYLEIESARFGPRLRYSIDVPPEMENIPIPPLSVETLVENSVKHAIAPRPGGGEIRVGASMLNGSVVLDVSDDGPGFKLDALPPGHGLDNLSARLTLLFGAAAHLEVVRLGKFCTARMSCPR